MYESIRPPVRACDGLLLMSSQSFAYGWQYFSLCCTKSKPLAFSNGKSSAIINSDVLFPFQYHLLSTNFRGPFADAGSYDFTKGELMGCLLKSRRYAGGLYSSITSTQ